ncbi:MAG: hypothetical protein LC109_11430 [Bacteroidia bacterium]|nr:hypothetical protein [Bacteroidia bacterium]
MKTKSVMMVFVPDDYDIVKIKLLQISTTSQSITAADEDKTTLEFFLENIFDKPSFREGQFPIISNALNQKDTIGLLPQVVENHCVINFLACCNQV